MLTNDYLERVVNNHHLSNRWAGECTMCQIPYPCAKLQMAKEILDLRRKLALRPRVKVDFNTFHGGTLEHPLIACIEVFNDDTRMKVLAEPQNISWDKRP